MARNDEDVTLSRGEPAIGRHEGVDGCTRVHRKELAVAGGVAIQSERPLNHGIRIVELENEIENFSRLDADIFTSDP